MRHEIAVSESTARGSIRTEVFRLEAIRLREGQRSRAHSRYGGGDEDRPGGAAFGYRAGSPENDRAGDADRYGALRRPVVGGEDRRSDTPEQEKSDQAVDKIEGKRPSPRHEHQCDDESRNVQHELLRHEVPIQLEHLIWEGDDYCEDHPYPHDQCDHAIRHPGNMLSIRGT